ncbi:hypothetical protein TSAR_000442 [Trichomalopsis sarcophagae]|uniref:Uncharacterized protein n=1 Tax=Trichomalopsis sarcophagae TaxID=543379 RepID=A0A232EHS0_9HYME|nr:hypothetical protein TSAR_000442 [Trichomalopsis sarcophagae]
MARYLIVALFIVLVVCLVQANSAPVQETTTANSIEDALKTAGDSLSKAFNDAKPKLDELLAKGQEFFDSVGKKISEEASKIIPKNEEKASA